MSRLARLAKYGPAAYAAFRDNREPIEKAVRAAAQRRKDRRTAFQHAATLKDGTVLRVFRDGSPVWVVFSGEEPITSYPAVDVPVADLTRLADLDNRQPARSGRRLPRPGADGGDELPGQPSPD